MASIIRTHSPGEKIPLDNQIPGGSADASLKVVTGDSHNAAQRRKYKPKLQPAGLPTTIENQKLIRKRLKEDLPKARKLAMRNRIELYLPLDFAQLQRDEGVNALQDEGLYDRINKREHGLTLKLDMPLTIAQPEVTQELPLTLPSPITMLGAGRVDPFANYPIPVASREKWLLERVYSASDPNSFTFKETWLPTAMKDATSFYQFLANVSLDLHWANGRDLNNPISAGYHTLALKAVNDKLSDPLSRISESVVYSITGFLCYDVYREDFSGFDIHMGGLAKIIELRGGFDTLNKNPSLRCMVFGVDLSAACRRDAQPRLKFPESIRNKFRSGILEKLREQCEQKSSISTPWWLPSPPEDHLLTRAIHDTRIAIEFTRYKEAKSERWKNVKFLTYWVDPILHTLVGNSIAAVDSESVMQEATRVGLILFLCKLRYISGQLGVETMLFVKKLKMLLLHGGLGVYLGSLEPMLLWIVVVGLLESWNMQERIWYMEMTVNLALEMSLQSWDTVVIMVKDVFWVDVAFDDEMERCRVEFESLLQGMSERTSMVSK